jgi:hypothetical protein
MEKPDRKTGRPRLYPAAGQLKRLSVYGDDQDLGRLRRLAEKWRCSQAAAVRRAITTAAEREGVE